MQPTSANAANAKVWDPNQPEWVKQKNLREIATIRESQKNGLVQHKFYGVDSSNNQELFVSPGENMFFTHTLVNSTEKVISYNVVI